MKMLRFCSIMIILTLLITFFAACNTRTINQSSNEVPVSLSSKEASISVESSPEESDSMDETGPIESQVEEGTIRTRFELDSKGKEAVNHINVSLDLPVNWCSKKRGIFDEEGNGIASFELPPMAKVTGDGQPFSYTDDIYTKRLNGGKCFSKELVVSGYPAKCYILELGIDGNNKIHTNTQYLYYILVDDNTCVLIFFSPKGITDRTDEFDKIVSSFKVLEN